MPYVEPKSHALDIPNYPLTSGASAGLGLALTRSIIARGDYAIATARSLKSFDRLRRDPNIDGTRLRCMTLDVTSPIGEIKKCINEARAIWGRIDVLVNNAGRVTYGVSEELGYVLPSRVVKL